MTRTFATRLCANGVYEYDTRDLLGHSSAGVTRAMLVRRECFGVSSSDSRDDRRLLDACAVEC